MIPRVHPNILFLIREGQYLKLAAQVLHNYGEVADDLKSPKGLLQSGIAKIAANRANSQIIFDGLTSLADLTRLQA